MKPQDYKRFNVKWFLIIVEFVLLLITISSNLLMLRIITGLLAFVLIPGYLNSRIMLNTQSLEELITFSLLLGFTFQIFLIAFFWTFTIEPINLNIVIPIATLTLVLILLRHLSEDRIALKLNDKKSLLSFMVVLLLAISTRLIYFISNTSTLGIDGGLYCSFARTIVTEGRFYVKVINDIVKGLTTPYYNLKGFTPYPLTIFSIAFFMFIGEASYTSAKIMTLFAGLLLVSLIYLFSKELFGLKAAIVAGSLAAMNPMLSYYSAILHGPEILSSLFSLGALYLFIMSLRNNTTNFSEYLKYGLLGGVFITSTFKSHGYVEFTVLISVLTLIYIIFNKNKLYNFLMALFSFALLFLVARYRHIPIIGILFTLVAMLYTFLLTQKKMKYCTLLTTTLLTAILTIWFLDVRSYLIPEVYVKPSMAVFAQKPTQVLNPFKTYTGINMDLEYIRKTLNRFWDSLRYTTSFIIFLLSFSSLILPSNKEEKMLLTLIPLITSILYTLYFPPSVSWYKGFLDIFPDRFLILSTSSIIILASSIFEDITKSTYENIRIGRGKIFQTPSSTLLVIALLLLFGLGFNELFRLPVGATHIEYLHRFKYYDPLEVYNLDKAIEWIKENMSRNASILAAEPRRLAWFTDRTMVGITEDPESITWEKLANLIKTFNVNYVFIDSFFSTYRVVSPDVKKLLYSEDLNEGEIIPLLDVKERLIEEIIESGNKSYTLNTLGLELVFSDRDPETNKVTRIYKVVSVKVKYRTLFVDTFDNMENSIKLWIPQRKCNLTIRNGTAILTIPTENSNWAYIISNTKIILGETKNLYFTYKVKGLTSTTKYWTVLVDTDGKWHKYPEDTKAPLNFTINVFVININKPIKYIFLGVSGKEYPAVAYDWVILFAHNVTKNR